MRRAIAILVVLQVMVCSLLALVVVNGITSRDALKQRVTALEEDKARLQDRVDALEAFLRANGIDPGTVPAHPGQVSKTPRRTPTPTPAPVVTVTRRSRTTTAPSSPSGRRTAGPRPSRTPASSPSPRPSPSPTCTRVLVVCLPGLTQETTP